MRLQKLSDYIEIKHGFAFSGDHITDQDNNIVLVTPGNFRIGGGFQEEKCKFFNGDLPDDYILNAGDYIVTMTDLSKDVDTLGFSAKVPSTPYRTYLHNQRIGKLYFVGEDCDKDYIYYLMQTHHYQRTIANSSTGATVHHTSPSKIYEYRYKVPPIHVQRRISGILAAYDDLIENNRRQIKLLEEAAQRLYKEWFIDLRFPGWEETPIVDGLPGYWHRVRLGDIANIVMGQSPKSEFFNARKEGLPFHQGVGSFGNRFVIDDTYSLALTRIGEAGSILFSVRAPVGRLNLTKNRVVIGRGIAAVNSNYGHQSLLFYMLKDRFFEDDLIGNGSIFGSINKDELHDLTFIYPSAEIADAFNFQAKAYDEMISVLHLKIQDCQLARDALLPKLINGELEV